MASYQCLVAGKLVAPAATFEVVNPSTGEVIAACPDVSAEQTEAAIQAAGPSIFHSFIHGEHTQSTNSKRVCSHVRNSALIASR